MAYIKVPVGREFALIDEKDAALVVQYTWKLHRSPNGTYAVSRTPIRDLLMHRLLTGAGDDMQVDHINHNGLDNRRANLRLANNQQNCFNSRPRGGSSQYRGVYWHTRDRRWRARLKFSGKVVHESYHDTEQEAAMAWNQAALETYGEYAYQNVLS